MNTHHNTLSINKIRKRKIRIVYPSRNYNPGKYLPENKGKVYHERKCNYVNIIDLYIFQIDLINRNFHQNNNPKRF